MSDRYFVAGLHRLDTEELERMDDSVGSASSAESASAPASATAAACASPESGSSASRSASISTAGDSCAGLGRVSTLLTIARSVTRAPYAPAASQPSYLPLPADDEEHTSYTIDTAPSDPSANMQRSMLCPDQLDDMLVVVRELRRDRMDMLQTRGAQGHALVTPAVEERRVARDNANNFTMTNLSDFM